jgi:outer membrane protein OmpA-like peptidoglycan-associated protein
LDFEKVLAPKVFFDLGSSEVKGKNLATLKEFGLNLKKFGRAITITATGYAQPTVGGAKRDAALSL